MKTQINNLGEFLAKNNITDLNYQGVANVSVALSRGKLLGFVIMRDDVMFFVSLEDARKEIDELKNVDTNWQMTSELLTRIHQVFAVEKNATVKVIK